MPATPPLPASISSSSARLALAAVGLTLAACASSSVFERSLERAERGEAAAQYQVGVAYLIGTEIGPDLEAAARWLRRAAEGGNADAELDLGILYYRGLGVPQDVEESFRWFARAARKGNAKAQANVGVA